MTSSRGRVVVVGLGPGGPELVTAAALDAIARSSRRFVRTSRHPSAGVVEPAVSFDHVYESSASMDEVYATIVERLVAEASSAPGDVLYAVPGSPAVAERSVQLLVADGRVDVDVVPALSFLDLAWVRLGVDPFASGVRIVDGHRFAVEAAGERGPLLVGQCDSRAVLSEIKLAFEDHEPASVVVLQRLGLQDESVTTVAWHDLDRVVEPDHLTSLWIPSLAAPVAAELVAFAQVVQRLREECPWDREQTHASLTKYVLEEAYEVVDAIHEGSVDHLEEELGDLLLQVVLHAAIAAQAGDFTLADVARGISEKMVRRHPHVFGDVSVADADEVHRNWEQIKRQEREDGSKPERAASALDGIPGSLPALSYAAKLSKRAAAVGFDWRVLAPVFDKVREELAELEADPSADELGDVLFSVVNVARHLGHDPEGALRGAATKFRRRFELVEQAAEARGLDLASAEESLVDDLWEQAKAQLRDDTP
ncbi:MAG TPA: nucleoside triphosphate pyrophosphohydrolase [Acidimicrobiales bacterium]|nr:nucleoside triphosphate pyrophosphohydrolase [Acidimicrobiales bacterium]